MLLWFIYICGCIGACVAMYESEMQPRGQARKFSGDVFAIMLITAILWPMSVVYTILRKEN